jgi:hypothetical protein
MGATARHIRENADLLDQFASRELMLPLYSTRPERTSTDFFGVPGFLAMGCITKSFKDRDIVVWCTKLYAATERSG